MVKQKQVFPSPHAKIHPQPTKVKYRNSWNSVKFKIFCLPYEETKTYKEHQVVPPYITPTSYRYGNNIEEIKEKIKKFEATYGQKRRVQELQEEANNDGSKEEQTR